MMVIAGLTSALAVCIVLIAVGYHRLYRGEGSATAATSDVTATSAEGRPASSLPGTGRQSGWW